jgi:hypothetical protein
MEVGLLELGDSARPDRVVEPPEDIDVVEDTSCFALDWQSSAR